MPPSPYTFTLQCTTVWKTLSCTEPLERIGCWPVLGLHVTAPEEFQSNYCLQQVTAHDKEQELLQGMFKEQSLPLSPDHTKDR